MIWLIVLGVFMAGSWIAEKWAHSATSLGTQYAGLALYVVLASNPAYVSGRVVFAFRSGAASSQSRSGRFRKRGRRRWCGRS